MSQKRTVVCKHCGMSLPPSHKGRCPNCGKTTAVIMTFRESVIITDSGNWVKRREFYQENPIVKWLSIAVTIISILSGLFIHGWEGAIVGLAIALISNLLAPYIGSQIREIREGRL